MTEQGPLDAQDRLASLQRSKLGLGVFAFNGLAGVGTTVPDQFQLNWPNCVAVAQQADRLGFEAIVPYARFRAIGAPTHYSGRIYENFTWSAGIAALTNSVKVMSTVHVTNVHPVLAAKAMTTIDHISNGRFALNIVCGWIKPEQEMFGTAYLSHAERYEYADEWITAIKRLWTEDQEFDFVGKHVTVLHAQSQPKPIQKPFPILMNAATSPDGKHFAAKHCDIAFVVSDELDEMKREVAEYRAIARQHYGREIQIWTVGSVIQADTNREAQALAERYADHADLEYITEYMAGRVLTPEQRAVRARRFAMGGNGIKFIGDAERVAADIADVSAMGVDGILLTWVDYQRGIRRFGEGVLPLLEQNGLRRAINVDK